LADFWARRGHHTEGRAWLQTLLEQVSLLPEVEGEAAKERCATQAKAILALSTMVFVTGDIATALTHREASARLYRQLGDRQGLGRALGLLGYVAMLRGEMTEAEQALREAITLGRESDDKFGLSFALTIQSRFFLAATGDLAAARISSAESARVAREIGMPWSMAQAVVTLAGVAAYAGEWDEARAHIREALALFHQLGDRYRFNTAHSELAHIERRAGNLAEAQRLYRQSIIVWQEFGQRAAIAHQLECFAYLARVQHQCSRAARLFGAAEALREMIGAPMTSPERTEYAREVTALHGQMEAKSAAAQWATGRTLTMDQAIAYAVAV
jgi:tetratricopeptide (TPR) repeat protein